MKKRIHCKFVIFLLPCLLAADTHGAVRARAAPFLTEAISPFLLSANHQSLLGSHHFVSAELRAAAGPALSVSGLGLANVEFPFDGTHIHLNLHAIFNMALADTAHTFQTVALLTWANAFQATHRYHQAVYSLRRRIARHTNVPPQLIFVDGLRRRYYDLLLAAIESQTHGLVSEERVEALASALADDVWLHPGTIGAGREPTIYADSLDRPELENLPADIIFRLLVHELHHLALRFEAGKHPDERDARARENNLQQRFKLAPLDAWLEYVAPHSGVRLLNSLFPDRTRVLAQKYNGLKRKAPTAKPAAPAPVSTPAVKKPMLMAFWWAALYQSVLHDPQANRGSGTDVYGPPLKTNYREALDFLKSGQLSHVIRIIEQFIAPREQVIAFIVRPIEAKVNKFYSAKTLPKDFSRSTRSTLVAAIKQWRDAFNPLFVKKGEGLAWRKPSTEDALAQLLKKLDKALLPLLSLPAISDVDEFLAEVSARAFDLMAAIRDVNARAAKGEPLLIAVNDASLPARKTRVSA